MTLLPSLALRPLAMTFILSAICGASQPLWAGQAMGKVTLDMVTEEPPAPKRYSEALPVIEATPVSVRTPLAVAPASSSLIASVSSPAPQIAAPIAAEAGSKTPEVAPASLGAAPALSSANNTLNASSVSEKASPATPEVHPPVTPVPEAAPRGSMENQPIAAPAASNARRGVSDANHSSPLPFSQGTLKVFGGLGVVLLLIVICRWAVGRFAPGMVGGPSKGVFETLARFPIAKNQALVLVRVGSQLVVLNQTRDRSESVLVISEPMEVAGILGQIQGGKPQSIQASFNRMLETAQSDLERPQAAQDLEAENLEVQLDEMASAKQQLVELREQLHAVRQEVS